MARQVEQVVRAVATSDGAGVRIRRSIGIPALQDLDPFLLLDHFDSTSAADYIAGFPDHPHRGFETVTWMLEGRMRHRDNQGHSGLLVPGGVQWMTAGRGIVHSEMPEQTEGRMSGFQLWVNLPAALKMTPPRYREFGPDAVPDVTTAAGVRIRVIAGQAAGRSGPVTGIAVDPLYLDIALPAGTTHTQPLPQDHTAFACVFEGACVFGGNGVFGGDDGAGGTVVPAGHLAVFGPGDRVVPGAGTTPTRLLLVAGRPIREPVARYGPFVMNSKAEIETAIDDFRSGRF